MHLNSTWLALSALTVVSAQQSQCHDYVLVSIRGTYEVQGPSIGFIGTINTTLNTVPGGIEYDAVYPAAADQTAYLGGEDVVRYITEGLESCPDQKYAILGYSQGASATGIALRNYTDPESAGYQAIRAVLVIGNTYHRPNASVNVDQGGGNSTRGFSGVFPWNETQGIPDIYYNNGKLLDICYFGDIICAPQSPNSSFTQHLQYGLNATTQKLGSDFLIERLTSNDTSTNTTTTTTSGGPSSSTPVPSSTTSGSAGTNPTSSASTTSSTAGPTSPTAPGVASGMFPSSVLALVVGVIAFIATA